MTEQLSDCCKAKIKLTGSPNHEDGFACEKCGRIIGTSIYRIDNILRKIISKLNNLIK